MNSAMASASGPQRTAATLAAKSPTASKKAEKESPIVPRRATPPQARWRRVGCRRDRARLPRRPPRRRRARAGARGPAPVAARCAPRSACAPSASTPTPRRAAGDLVVEEHDETGAGAGRHEELYVVVAGRARFTLGGEELDAPAGTCVFLPDPSVVRTAVGVEPATTVLAIGGAVGEPYRVSPWEYFFRAAPHAEAGDWERAAAVAAEGLAEHPGQRRAALQPRLLRGARRAPRRRPRAPARGGGRRPRARARLGRRGRRPGRAPRPRGLPGLTRR